MTKIEEVARAILKARYYDCEPEMYGNSLEGFFAAIDPEHLEDARIEARAAIEAMREPTTDMKMAGGRKCEDIMFGGDPDEGENVFADMGSVYTVMVDAALAEGEGDDAG